MTNHSPKISVITPSFNSSKYLEQAIQSVMDQDYPNFEHIIVDGGSMDGTLDILKKHPHLRWVSEPDNGQSDAMNKGFAMSSGDIIVYLNCDDYFLPLAFKEVIPFFERGAKFVVGRVKVINDDGSSYINDPEVQLPLMLKWWKDNAYCYNPVGYFYLREVQENVAFNENNHYSMDFEFLLDASLKYQITKSDQVLGVFRYITGTKTSSLGRIEQQLEILDFADKYLVYCDKEYAEAYRIEKEDFVRQRKKYEKELLLLENVAACLKNKKHLMFIYYGLNLFFKWPDKYFKKLVKKVLSYLF